MAGDEGIRTQFDDILSSLRESGGKAVSAHKLSSVSRMPQADVLKWLSVLERSGHVHIENRLTGIYARWVGFGEKTKPRAEATMDAMLSSAAAEPREIELASQQAYPRAAAGGEAEKKRSVPLAESDAAPMEIRAKEDAEAAKLRRKMILESAGAEIEAMSGQLERVETLLSELKKKKAEHREAELRAMERTEKGMANSEKKAVQKLEMELREAEEKSVREQLQARRKAQAEAAKLSKEAERERKLAERKWKAEQEKVKKEEIRLEEVRKEAVRIAERERTREEKERAEEGRRLALLAQVEKQALFADEEAAGESAYATELSLPEEPHIGVPQILPAYSKKNSHSKKIKKPEPVQLTGVSMQFSERMARQVKKIVAQGHELEKLRMDKERLLSEHYLPLQRRLESEIETISDRIIRMEQKVVGMQQRASELPGQVSSVEKLQSSAVKAHNDMRRAYDEASALIEESSRLLSEEREKMEVMVEQSREEIAAHQSKTEELGSVLRRISSMEQEANDMVSGARAALAEQAERLATAEKYSQELSGLKSEISENVASIKREISATKGALTSMEKQMGQMRQIEIWADSIRQDYGRRMSEVGDYIKHGNEEFDTLRESVEASFVRRYLRELRQLAEGYAFEFGQVKKAEEDIDHRMESEKKKLEELLGESKKIAQSYESQARLADSPGADAFEKRGETFRTIEEVAVQREQLQQAIAQLVGGKTEYSQEMPRMAKKAARRPEAAARGASGRRVQLLKKKAGNAAGKPRARRKAKEAKKTKHAAGKRGKRAMTRRARR